MEFNLLEVLTVQVRSTHWEAFGNAFCAIRDRVKQQIESHAARGAGELNILIISDLLHGPVASPSRMATALNAEAQRNPGTAILLALANQGVDEPTARIGRYLEDSSVSARWLGQFNPPTHNASDPENYDLHALYALLADLDIGSRLRWHIDRTVFSDDRTQLFVVETTAFGVKRRSLFWDSNDPLPHGCDGKYDLILMRRGVCYCEQVYKQWHEAACCGAARCDDSDVHFLEKVHAALARHDRSAAYLSGWNTDDKTPLWKTATERAGIGLIVPPYQEVIEMGGDSAGIYVSRGRPFSSNTLKTGSPKKRKSLW